MVEFVEGKVDWKGKAALKSKHGGFKTSLLLLVLDLTWLVLDVVAVTVGLETMATLALAVNLTTYFNTVMHFELADAATHVTNFVGTGYILPIFWALLADLYTGRFKIVLVSGTLEFMGLALLTVQSHQPKLKPPPCSINDPNSRCKKVDGGNAVLLFLALYFIAAGTAGLKAALISHGADQFDEKDPKESKQMSSFFNCLLLAANLGSTISLTLIVWIQGNKGWDWGFLICTVGVFLGMAFYVAGSPFYRIHVAQGTSAIIEILQVYVASIRNRKLKLPENPDDLYEIDRDNEAAKEAEFLPHKDIFRFLDKAAIPTPSSGQGMQPEIRNPWELCPVTQVENAKIILGMVPIFCCTIIMTLCLAQLQTFSIQQGLTMDSRVTSSFSIPPASLPVIPGIFMILIIPAYDRIFVPFARKITGHPTGITHLQRIGSGLVLNFLSMASAAILETRRKQVAKEHNMLDAIPVVQPLPISTLWLCFQYFIFGIADIFTYVGLLEFFYSEAPKGLKSTSTCFLWSSMALGYFLSSILVNIVNAATKGNTKSGGWLAGNNINKNHLDLFFWLIFVLSSINFVVYLFVAKMYRYRAQTPVISRERNKA